MKPKRIILIRHGQSEGNVDRAVYKKVPDYKLNLTPKGKQQARECGEQLRDIVKDESCFFYVSPLWRTRQTFQGITEAFPGDQYEMREEPRIREQEWGHLKDIATCDRIDKARDEYGAFYYRIPDGESAADVYDRVSDFFGTLHRDFEKPDFPKNCIIVTHGMSIRLFLMRWFHWTVEEFDRLKNPENCAIIILERNDQDKYDLVSALGYKEF